MALSSTQQARTSDPRMWIVTIIFLSCITVGGVFLVQYITLPDTHENSSHPIIGLVLVAVPWFFWFMTFLYRLLWKTQMAGAQGPPKPAAAAPSSETNDATGDIEAGSSTGRNMIEGEEEDHQGGLGVSNLSKGSSRHSHESEVPLAFAMAS